MMILMYGCYKDSQEFIPHTSLDATFALRSFAPKPQSYILDISADTTVFISETGKILSIPKNSLVLSDGTPINGPVRMHYAESNAMSDFIFHGINTLLENQPVYVTKGVYVNFYYGNEQLILNPKNKNLRWIIPIDKEEKDIRIFVSQGSEDRFNDLKIPANELNNPEFGQFMISTSAGLKYIRGYSMPVQTKSWNVIGSFSSREDLVPVHGCFDVPAVEDNKQVTALLISPGERSMVLNYHAVEGKSGYCLPDISLSETMDYWIFVLKVQKGEMLSYALQKTNVNELSTGINPEFKLSTVDGVKKVLESIR